MFYIYALIDPRTGEPFYIGKGKHKNNRHLDHFKASENRHLKYKIEYLQSNGFEIGIKFLAENINDENVAYDIEENWIATYGRKNIDEGGILTNILLSRNPPSRKNKKQSKEHIEKRILSYRKTCQSQGRKKFSKETKKKISEAVSGEKNGFYGKTHSKEFKSEHSERMKGNKNNSKTYKLLDPQGKEFIVEGRLYKFCEENGLPRATVEAILYKGKVPKKGKAAGWKIERIEK
jgi:hypothetical protein